MAKHAVASVSKLASVSQSINHASNQLSAQLTEIEKALNSYGLGVSAWVNLSIAEDSDTPQVHQLGYSKHDGKWCLLLANYRAQEPEKTRQQKPLLESPREIRLLAVQTMPELVNKLVDAAEKCAQKTAERAVAARAIAASLNPINSKDDIRPQPEPDKEVRRVPMAHEYDEQRDGEGWTNETTMAAPQIEHEECMEFLRSDPELHHDVLGYYPTPEPPSPLPVLPVRPGENRPNVCTCCGNEFGHVLHFNKIEKRHICDECSFGPRDYDIYPIKDD